MDCSKNQVVISGIGAICSLGKSVNEMAVNLFAGEQYYIDRPTLFDSSLSAPVFEVNDFKTSNARTLKLALHAVDEAYRSAFSDKHAVNKKIGVVVGTTVGCMFNSLSFYKDFRDKNNPDFKHVKSYLSSNLGNTIKERFGFNGPAMTVTTACVSSSHAMGIGMEWIRNNVCDIVIAGGADELDLIPYTGFNSLQLLSQKPCKPFDAARNGLNLGEGAGFVVLESLKSAQERNIDIKLKLCGYATFSDAYHLTSPEPQGKSLEKSIFKALEMAEICPENIDYINAHGTGTKDNDKVEGSVIKRVFGENAHFSSTKALTGHTLGASGGIEAVICCIGLSNNTFPLNARFETIDSEIGVAPLTKVYKKDSRYALSSSLGFGGGNSALIIEKITRPVS